jgi:hypothetical protein
VSTYADRGASRGQRGGSPTVVNLSFLDRNEHCLHRKSKAIPVTGRGGPQVFAVRYEHHLHIKSKAIPVTGRGGPYVFPVRYEHHVHIKSKAISVTGRGVLYGFEMVNIPHCLDNLLTDGDEVVTTHRPRVTPHQHYLFLSLVMSSVTG